MRRRSLFLRLASRLEGPQTLGRGRRFWIGAAIVLALAAAVMLHAPAGNWPQDIGEALLVGLLATPLAPVAKDLSSALATAVNTLQLAKK